VRCVGARIAARWFNGKINLTIDTDERGLRAYRACGFVEEGRLRQHVWGDGRYIDLVYMGVLREEWQGKAGDK